MKDCPKCGDKHDRTGKFCSRSCANSRLFSEETKNKQREALLRFWEDKRKKSYCCICNDEYVKKKYETKCPKCISIYLEIRNNTGDDKLIRTQHNKTRTQHNKVEYSTNLIITGKIHELCEPVIRRHVKRYLISKFGNICMICGITDWCGNPVPLVCDHIDGDSTNSLIDNFRNICCNCDALLPTHKSKNKGRGRIYDKQYRRKKALEDAGVGSPNALEMRSAHENGQ